MAHESHHQSLGYADYSSTGNTAVHNFEPGHELYSLQAGIEMLGIPSNKHQQCPEAWRGFFSKAGSSSSIGEFVHGPGENLTAAMPESAAASALINSWQQSNRMLVQDSSLRGLFPGEGNEQLSQRLSLSLYNPEPSEAIVGLQRPIHHHLASDSRDGLYTKAAESQQDGRFFPPSSSPTASLYQQPHQLKSSKFLIPAQELLNEFCSLGVLDGVSPEHKTPRTNKWEEGGSSSTSSWNQQSLYSLDLLELQKRKAKLFSMLEEVGRRYRKYCEQMREVVLSFEAVAGEGSAAPYSRLASKVMSRHFRCLRDGIVGQIRAVKKAMGEKDLAVPGATRGETPRLRFLDQCLRQQKAFQQAAVMESHPWRPQRGLPERSVSILRSWLFEHFLHPYPSDVDKHILARQTGLSRSQVSNWFINARVRLWKPMVEEMYLEETKEHENQSSHEENDDHHHQPGQLQSNQIPNPNPSSSQLQAVDQKPTSVQLFNDSDSLSSIISSSHHHHLHLHHHHDDGRVPINTKSSLQNDARHQQQLPRAENFGMVDFTPYSDCSNQNFGSRVSLTLGLQQHNREGMSLSFSTASQQSFLFSREQIEECQPGQFALLDGEAPNLQHRNLVGAQLLHDFAG